MIKSISKVIFIIAVITYIAISIVIVTTFVIYKKYLFGLFLFMIFFSPFLYGLYKGYSGEEVENKFNDEEWFFKFRLATLPLIFYILGISTFIFQSYHYLKEGVWVPYSIISGLKYLCVEWASTPKTWIGLHTVFTKIPISITFFTIGIIVTILKNIIIDDY